MNRQGSEIEKLIESFLDHEMRRLEAVRRLDAAMSNRHQVQSWKATDTLALTAEGRIAVERLLGDPTDYVRARAAGVVMHWAPERAIPILGRYLDSDLSHIDSVEERLDIVIGAKDWLYAYFKIRTADRNDLIEPLKAYGVELSYRDHSKWQ